MGSCLNSARDPEDDMQENLILPNADILEAMNQGPLLSEHLQQQHGAPANPVVCSLQATANAGGEDPTTTKKPHQASNAIPIPNKANQAGAASPSRSPLDPEGQLPRTYVKDITTPESSLGAVPSNTPSLATSSTPTTPRSTNPARKPRPGSLKSKRNRGPEYQLGDVVQAQFAKLGWIQATVTRDNGNGTYNLSYQDPRRRKSTKPMRAMAVPTNKLRSSKRRQGKEEPRTPRKHHHSTSPPATGSYSDDADDDGNSNLVAREGCIVPSRRTSIKSRGRLRAAKEKRLSNRASSSTPAKTDSYLSDATKLLGAHLSVSGEQLHDLMEKLKQLHDMHSPEGPDSRVRVVSTGTVPTPKPTTSNAAATGTGSPAGPTSPTTSPKKNDHRTQRNRNSPTSATSPKFVARFGGAVSPDVAGDDISDDEEDGPVFCVRRSRELSREGKSKLVLGTSPNGGGLEESNLDRKTRASFDLLANLGDGSSPLMMDDSLEDGDDDAFQSMDPLVVRNDDLERFTGEQIRDAEKQKTNLRKQISRRGSLKDVLNFSNQEGTTSRRMSNAAVQIEELETQIQDVTKQTQDLSDESFKLLQSGDTGHRYLNIEIQIRKLNNLKAGLYKTRETLLDDEIVDVSMMRSPMLVMGPMSPEEDVPAEPFATVPFALPDDVAEYKFSSSEGSGNEEKSDDGSVHSKLSSLGSDMDGQTKDSSEEYTSATDDKGKTAAATSDDPRLWNAAKVTGWLKQSGFGDMIDDFLEEEIDGHRLLRINSAELKDIANLPKDQLEGFFEQRDTLLLKKKLHTTTAADTGRKNSSSSGGGSISGDSQKSGGGGTGGGEEVKNNSSSSKVIVVS